MEGQRKEKRGGGGSAEYFPPAAVPLTSIINITVVTVRQQHCGFIGGAVRLCIGKDNLVY